MRTLPPWARLVLLAVVLLGVFFRFYHLDRKVYWEDEIAGTVRALGYTEAGIVRAAPGLRDARSLQAYFAVPQRGSDQARLASTVRALASEDPQHPPAYYLASHLWMERFGSSANATRALSALFGVLALPCAYWLALELFGSVSVALVAAALLAVSPFHVLYAQEAREYSLWTVALLLVCVTFLRARRSATVAAWAIYAAMLAAGMYVFPFTGLVALGQGAFLLAERERSARAYVGYGAACLLAAAAFAPWLRIMLTNAALGRGLGHILTSHVSAPTIVRIFLKNVREIFFDLGSRGGFALDSVLALGTTVLALYALYRLARSERRTALRFVLLALCAPALPLLVSDLLGRGMLVYQSRYFTPLYLGVELAVAFLFASQTFAALGSWRRLIWRALFGVVLAGGVASCVISAGADTWWNKDYEQSRAVASVVNAAADPLVVADDRASRTLGLGWYLDPRVKLHLRLACDNCDQRTIALPARGPAPVAGERFSDVYLLGPGSAAEPGRVHRIDISAYPRVRTPLAMFLPQ